MKSRPEQLGHDPATGRNLVLWSASLAPDVREANDELSDHDEDLVMTTWHDSEPLDEALWFFLRSTTPPRTTLEAAASDSC